MLECTHVSSPKTTIYLGPQLIVLRLIQLVIVEALKGMANYLPKGLTANVAMQAVDRARLLLGIVATLGKTATIESEHLICWPPCFAHIFSLCVSQSTAQPCIGAGRLRPWWMSG